MKRLIILDANALVHRGFYALPPFVTKKGELVNAVYGFTSVLLKVLKELKPDYIVAVFDLPKPTFRHLEYKKYKATRAKTPKELYRQFPIVKKVVKTFDIPIFEKEGFEADDIIGTITKKTNKDIENIIVTGDLDALQLINKNTKVCILKKGMSDVIIYDTEKTIKRYEMKPIQLLDFKGLRGDPSDNIPGVPGVGEKTAISLLKKFKTIENLYKNIEKKGNKDIPELIKKKLLRNKDQAVLSKRLATIKCDVPIKFKLKDCLLGTYNQQEVVKIFQKLGFKSLISRLPSRQLTI